MWMPNTVHDGISGGFIFDSNTVAIERNSVAGITDHSNTNEGVAQVLEFIASSSFNWKEVGEGYYIRRGR